MAATMIGSGAALFGASRFERLDRLGVGPFDNAIAAGCEAIGALG